MRDSYSRSYIAQCLKNDADQLQKDLDGIIKYGYRHRNFSLSAELATMKLSHLKCFKYKRALNGVEFGLLNQEGQEIMSFKLTWTHDENDQDKFTNLADCQAFIDFFREARRQFLKLKWNRVPTEI